MSVSSRTVSGAFLLYCFKCLYSPAHDVWLLTARLLHLNHRNDATLVFLIPSVFGMGPSVLFPALSPVFRTNLRGSRELWQKVFCLLSSVLLIGNCLLVGFLATNRNVRLLWVVTAVWFLFSHVCLVKLGVVLKGVYFSERVFCFFFFNSCFKPD